MSHNPTSQMLRGTKRILIFSLAYHPMVGGAELAVKEITNRVSDIKFDMITLRFDRSHQHHEKIGNIDIYRIGGGLGYLSKVLFVPHAAVFAFKLRIKNDYDAFWAIMTNMLFPIVLMRFFGNRTPYILTLQDGDPFEYVFKRLRIRIFLPILKYGFRNASKVQAISRFLAQWAKQMGYQNDIEIIPNGVDYWEFSRAVSKDSRHKIWGDYGINYTDVILITTSRLVYKNAVDVIIRAVKLFPENICLVIFGAGPEQLKLEILATKLKIFNRVHFCGEISNSKLVHFLKAADIFVRPSRSEGMGTSFIEAMAAGLPVIATPVGGIVDFLKDGETGLFCEVNKPESIVKQVTKLLKDYDLRKTLVENGKKLAKDRYDWNLIANEMKTRVFDKV